MELIGARCVTETTDTDGVFLKVEPLTVLYGPNDSGKSRLLRSLAGDGRPQTTRLYYELARWQVDRLLERCCTDLDAHLDVLDALEFVDGELRWTGETRLWVKDPGALNVQVDDGGLHYRMRLGARDLRIDTSIVGLFFSTADDDRWGDRLISELRGVAGLAGQEWDLLFAALAESQIFAFEPITGYSGTSAFWCLPPKTNLSRDVEDLVLNLYPDGWPTSPTEPVPFLSASLERYHPDGLLDVVELPRRFETAEGWGDTSLQLQRLAEAIERSRRYVTEMQSEGEWRGKTFDVDAQVRAAEAANLILEGLVTDALPTFVAERYVPLSVSSDGPWRIDLVDREFGHQFPSRDVAEGYRSWMRLSIDVASRTIFELATLQDGFIEPDPSDKHLFPDIEDWILAFVNLGHRERAERDLAVRCLRRAWDAVQDGGQGDRQLYGLDGPHGEVSVSTATGGRRPAVYLLDEPERNLHPALQRQAAEWLVQTMTDLGATAVIATHSTTFLDLDPDGVSFNRVVRPLKRSTVVETFEPRTLRLTDKLVQAMGLTRGELITLRRTVLLVEGVTDQAFLEGYAGRRLAQAGVVIVPMHGGKKAGRAVNGIVEGVLQFASLRTVLLLDHYSNEELAGLSPVDGSLEKAIAGSDFKDELLWAAQAADAAKSANVHLTSHGIGVKDIFMLASDDAVRQLNTGKRTGKTAKFPGHTVAAEDEKNWKKVYNDRWGLDLFQVDLFFQAGAAMAERGERIEILENLMAQLSRDHEVRSQPA